MVRQSELFDRLEDVVWSILRPLLRCNDDRRTPAARLLWCCAGQNIELSNALMRARWPIEHINRNQLINGKPSSCNL